MPKITAVLTLAFVPALALIALMTPIARAQSCLQTTICDICLCPGGNDVICPQSISPGSYIYRSAPCTNCSISYRFNADDDEMRAYVLSIEELNNFLAGEAFQYYTEPSRADQDYYCGTVPLWSVRDPEGGGLAVIYRCTNEFFDCSFKFDYDFYDTCSYGCPDPWRGDNFCQPNCNVSACGFDDGDCGVSTVSSIASSAIANTANTANSNVARSTSRANTNAGRSTRDPREIRNHIMFIAHMWLLLIIANSEE